MLEQSLKRFFGFCQMAGPKQHLDESGEKCICGVAGRAAEERYERQ